MQLGISIQNLLTAHSLLSDGAGKFVSSVESVRMEQKFNSIRKFLTAVYVETLDDIHSSYNLLNKASS